MSKFISFFTALLLIFMLITPASANGQQNKVENSTRTITLDNDKYTVFQTESGSIRQVVVSNDEEEYEATFNKSTNELILDGEVVDPEFVKSIQEMGQELKPLIGPGNSNIANGISPLANEIGGGGSYKFFYQFNVTIPFGLLASLTIGSIITILTASINFTLPEQIVLGIASSLISYVATLNWSSGLYLTIKIYQTWFKKWTGKYASYIYVYSNSSRTKLLKVLIDD